MRFNQQTNWDLTRKKSLIWVQHECELLPAWGSAHWKSHLVFWAISQRFHQTMTVCYPFQRSNFWLVGKAGYHTGGGMIAWSPRRWPEGSIIGVLPAEGKMGRWEDDVNFLGFKSAYVGINQPLRGDSDGMECRVTHNQCVLVNCPLHSLFSEIVPSFH